MGKLQREFDSEIVEYLDLSKLVRIQHLIAAMRSTEDRQHSRQRQCARCRLILSRNQGIRGADQCEKPVVTERPWEASSWPQVGDIAPELVEQAEVWA